MLVSSVGSADGSELDDRVPGTETGGFRCNLGSHLLQDALVEELLQFLVTVVDAELLEAVVLKVF